MRRLSGKSSRIVAPLKDDPLYIKAYEAIKEAILSGRIRPGSRLSQVGLAEELKVSRAPVVDALSRLATEGLVERRPRSGYFVYTLTEKDVIDVYNVRCALECQALRDVSGTIESKDIAMLADILEASYDELKRGDMTGYILADDRFHAELVGLANNRILNNMWGLIRDQIQLIRVMVAVTTKRVMRAAGEHSQLIACLYDRDLVGAEAVLRHHIESVKLEVTRQLQRDSQRKGGS
ncbi:MAG: GntR family transcriptional regulator [Firmicutes bacterium]|nr:GntR family transcriptional regulator [Bacillota bacterium]